MALVTWAVVERTQLSRNFLCRCALGDLGWSRERKDSADPHAEQDRACCSGRMKPSFSGFKLCASLSSSGWPCPVQSDLCGQHWVSAPLWLCWLERESRLGANYMRGPTPFLGAREGSQWTAWGFALCIDLPIAPSHIVSV